LTASASCVLDRFLDGLGDAIVPIVNAAKHRIAQLETRVAELD